MASLLKKLTAARNFLHSCRQLPSFEALQAQQYGSLLKVIEAVPWLSVESAAAATAILDGTAWLPEQLDTLKQQLGSKVGEAMGSGRRDKKGQDYTVLVFHLLPQHFEALRREGMVGMQAVVEHLAALGLRNPSEETLAVLTTLVCWRQRQSQVTLVALEDAYETFKKEKPKFRKLLSLFADRVDAEALQTLPRSWRDLPEKTKRLVYGAAEPAEAPDFDAATILREGRLLPLRDTNRLLPSKATAAAPAAASVAPAQQLLQTAFAGMLSAVLGQLPGGSPAVDIQMLLPSRTLGVGAVARAASDAAGSSRQAADVPALPPPHVSSSPVTAPDVNAVPMLALPPPDSSSRPVTLPDVEALPAAGAVDDGDRFVERTPAKENSHGMDGQLRSLSEQLGRQPALREVLARPAAAASVAAASGTAWEAAFKRPACARKRPAACPGSAKKQRASPEAREQLLKRVPAKVLREFAQGCSSCRGRAYCTVSCWHKRGYY